jgi:hypothetical protein
MKQGEKEKAWASAEAFSEEEAEDGSSSKPRHIFFRSGDTDLIE